MKEVKKFVYIALVAGGMLGSFISCDYLDVSKELSEILHWNKFSITRDIQSVGKLIFIIVFLIIRKWEKRLLPDSPVYGINVWASSS